MFMIVGIAIGMVSGYFMFWYFSDFMRGIRLSRKIRRDVMGDESVAELDKETEVVRRRQEARMTTGLITGAMSKDSDPIARWL